MAESLFDLEICIYANVLAFYSIAPEILLLVLFIAATEQTARRTPLFVILTKRKAITVPRFMTPKQPLITVINTITTNT